MLLSSIRLSVHNALLVARQLDRIVLSKEFEEAFEVASNDAKTLLTVILQNKDCDQLRAWIRKQLMTTLEELSYADLRDMAAQWRIPRYSRLTKDELIIALEAKRGTASVGERRESTETDAADSGGSGDSGKAVEHADGSSAGGNQDGGLRQGV